ncbi:MFS transporter [Paralcaligenes sp. KSB-10]|nr:MFS transporter [Paralcaligenes sp. KSB-10]UHL63800.1 MFS transporter [Paralcaligenes sp. KSB-10]
MADSTGSHKKTSSADGLDAPRRYWAVLTLMSAMSVATLDATVANVALPTIAHELSIDPASVVWVVIAYSLMVVVSLLPLSAVAERIGFRRMFGLGITVFMLSSLACALSTSLVGLVSARIAQGLGAAMLMCLFGGLVRNIYPLRKLGFGISLNAMLVGVMSVLGPTIGAFILSVASWPWIFAINVPICLLSYLGIRFLPDVPRNQVRFDWVACALSVLAFGLSIVGLDALVKDPIHAAWCLAVAGLAGWVLMQRSRGQTAPLVPVDLLRIKPVAFAVAASAFSFAAQMASFVSLPFYFQKVMGHSYTEVGVLLGVWSLAVAIMAPIAGVMSDRFPVAILCAIGAGCMALGLAITILLPLHVGFGWVMGAMFFGGVGFGFFQTPNNRAMLAGAPRNRSGAAGGMQATTRVFGQSSGTALVAIAFTSSAAHGAMLGVVAAIVCAVTALFINIVRHLNPVADLDL